MEVHGEKPFNPVTVLAPKWHELSVQFNKDRVKRKFLQHFLHLFNILKAIKL